MNLKEHRKDFNRRWNITSLPDSSEEAFRKFKQRIITVFWNIRVKFRDDGWSGERKDRIKTIDNSVTPESIFDFCQYYSIEKKLTNMMKKSQSLIAS